VIKKFLSERLLHDLEPLCRAFQCYVNCAHISSVKHFEHSTSVREVRSSAVLRYRTNYGCDLHATSVLTAVPYEWISYRPCTAVNACTSVAWSIRGEKSWILLFWRDTTQVKQRRRSENPVSFPETTLLERKKSFWVNAFFVI
jgi:hypothetical protein